MSIHSSLRASAKASKHRNVLSRLERLGKLTDQGRWTEGQNSPLGIPKVRSIKAALKKKRKGPADAEKS